MCDGDFSQTNAFHVSKSGQCTFLRQMLFMSVRQGSVLFSEKCF